MENGSDQMLLEFMQETFQEQTCGVSDSPAKTSVSQDTKKDLREIVQACFSELQDFLRNSKKKIDPSIYSSRMLRIFFLLAEDTILPDFSLNWTRSGMMQNGKFSTRKTSEYHRTENDVSLLDILEVEVDEKFFLSEEMQRRLIFKEQK